VEEARFDQSQLRSRRELIKCSRAANLTRWFPGRLGIMFQVSRLDNDVDDCNGCDDCDE
jgi:hypothetical protein